MRGFGHEVHDDWYAPGLETDDYWKAYEQARGRTFVEALEGRHAKNVFEYDKGWLDWCDTAVLVLPAGKSGHLELGYCSGRGKETHILLDDVDRWDVMYRFADRVWENEESLIAYLSR